MLTLFYSKMYRNFNLRALMWEILQIRINLFRGRRCFFFLFFIARGCKRVKIIFVFKCCAMRNLIKRHESKSFVSPIQSYLSTMDEWMNCGRWREMMANWMQSAPQIAIIWRFSHFSHTRARVNGEKIT